MARQVTRISKTSKAETAFQARLKNRTLSYFNENEIPENQTTGSAFKLCKSVETAKKYCPDRWAAMEKWLDMARKVSYDNIKHFYCTFTSAENLLCASCTRRNWKK